MPNARVLLAQQDRSSLRPVLLIVASIPGCCRERSAAPVRQRECPGKPRLFLVSALWFNQRAARVKRHTDFADRLLPCL